MKKTYHIYYLCNNKGEPFYVGKTINPANREKAHKSNFKNRFVKLVVVQKTKDELKSLHLEYKWIERFDKMCYKLTNKWGNRFDYKDKWGILSSRYNKAEGLC